MKTCTIKLHQTCTIKLHQTCTIKLHQTCTIKLHQTCTVKLHQTCTIKLHQTLSTYSNVGSNRTVTDNNCGPTRLQRASQVDQNAVTSHSQPASAWQQVTADMLQDTIKGTPRYFVLLTFPYLDTARAANFPNTLEDYRNLSLLISQGLAVHNTVWYHSTNICRTSEHGREHASKIAPSAARTRSLCHHGARSLL
jgi:hypothetical protein